jgi:phospholipid-translocating ATPase
MNLVPVVLLNQFKFFSNLFFLLIALSQMFPPLRVGFLFTYVAPLAIVLMITIAKEAVDDYKRFKRDKEANSQVYKRVTRQGLVDIASADIKEGDLIQINANERIPADMILLHTTDKSGSIFLRTDQLDGETDWKLRKPVVGTQEISDVTKLYSDNNYVFADPPSKQIYYFKGNFVMQQGTYTKKEPLCLEQTMWTNTVLAASTAVGVVIYTGKETRAQMNSSNPQTKVGAIDMELNFISKSLFTFMFLCSIGIVMLSGFQGSLGQNLISIFRFLLLLSSIIPISLRVNLDFAKIIYAYKISNDENIPETIARNSTIPEELGRIQYLFTDKTGTLTQNDMVFKQICFESGNFTEEGLDELASILRDECRKSSGPLKDVEDNYSNTSPEQINKKRLRRNRNNVVRDAITALSLCHNVTPVEENGEKIYQASSPDEVALVKFADSLQMVLTERSQMRIQILNADEKPEDYEILANFPFSSETKRMGILLKHLESGRLVFYLKGAEVVMENKVQENSRPFLRETCENLASTGLRTLVISQKFVPPEEYAKWERKYNLAKTEMEDREKKVQQVVEELEEGMEFLCVTGVEDKLQVDVTDTIESLRNGGVQIWMLTGDKVETATCIAISTGLKSKSQSMFFMKELKKQDEIDAHLKIFEKLEDTILIIDGNTLHIALEEPIRKYFFKVASKVSINIYLVSRCCLLQMLPYAENISRQWNEVLHKYQNMFYRRWR